MNSQTIPAKPEHYFCSEGSRQSKESMLGTAPQATTWMLLEHSAIFGEKALAESVIPEEVKTHLNQALEQIPLSKLLLIRKTLPADKITFYIAKNTPTAKLYKYELDDYAEIVGINLVNFDKGNAPLADEKLFLVCTNGKRDQCCARFGVPVYKELLARDDLSVWQSSHIGQHRFAANFLAFPDGVCYGQVTPENAGSIVDKYLGRQVHLPNLRGRSQFPKPAQAAEAFLREHLGDYNLASLQFESLEVESENQWTVVFNRDEQQFKITVDQTNDGEPFYASCKGDKPVTPTRFNLLNIEAG
jgi:hypothetical protein